MKTQHCSSIWQIELRLNRQNLAISAGVEKSGLRIGHGLAIAQPGALNAEFDGLGVDALGSGALLVDIAFTVKLVADARADAGGDLAIQPPLGHCS